MSERVEFAKVLAFLAALYPRFKLEDATIDAYYTILGDLPADLLKIATLQIGSEPGPWFPSAGDLRAKVFALIEQQSGMPSASEAWGEVVRRAGTHGHIREPEFSDPLIYRAVEAVGGWQAVCLSDNPVADRARFLEAYGVLLARQRTEAAMLPAVRETLAQITGGDGKKLLEVSNA